MSRKNFGFLGDPEADESPLRTLKGWRKSVDYAEKRKDDAFEAWKADPTTQNRVYYDIAVKSWAMISNTYDDKLREALGK